MAFAVRVLAYATGFLFAAYGVGMPVVLPWRQQDRAVTVWAAQPCASREFDDRSGKRPHVQVVDPFTEKRLMVSLYEIDADTVALFPFSGHGFVAV